MSWFGFLRSRTSGRKIASETATIPLFPVNGLLFPEGRLALKISEPRYLDMAARCLKDETPFGVCLIASGKESGEPATPHTVGTLAHIEAADVPQLGSMTLKVRGGRRFRIVSQTLEQDGLMTGHIELLAEKAIHDIPAGLKDLIPLLKKIVADLGPEKMPEPHDFSDPNWVGYRLTEILPVQLLAKQKLLELDDPVSRLEILHTYLAQREVIR
ncbi:LON peptidase substrate-binding domain-containing protein [Propionivibrio limicola]|uniref:LON peptidase substrate-binding domain-containing protein n=1 Tax=Propionivibrio limicola TaxID=167645 RepID=UPI00129176DA|nr:LON peptidase substrate-binding domain-containing protein [Propionivibrio limicola]